MNPGFATKQLIKKFVYNGHNNLIIRNVLRPFSGIVPNRLLMRIPLVGVVHINIDETKTLKLKVKGLDQIVSTLYWYGLQGYEAPTMKVFFNLLKRADTILDIGANIGLFGLLAAILEPRKQVFAFEPVPHIFNILQENARINGLDNLHCEAYAVTNYDGKAKLYIPHAGIPTSASFIIDPKN